tara:strand:- start:713 stop:859 length:147 start_codon:yes stop_codon:yes gene_type:complete
MAVTKLRKLRDDAVKSAYKSTKKEAKPSEGLAKKKKGAKVKKKKIAKY